MKVILAQPRGFCAGVVRAIEIVERALERYGPPIYVRHEIVHNKYVVETLKAKGVRFVEELEDVPSGAHAIFSAHGVSKDVEREAVARGLRVIDATCPLVTKVHNHGRRYVGQGRTIILIGHAGHPEVEGTMGQISGPVLLVQSEKDVEALDIAVDHPVAYVTQTTLSVDDTKGIIQALHRRFTNIVGPETRDICYATQNRQIAVRELCKRADVILVVGAKNSSNSNRLREIGEEAKKPSYLVADGSELQVEWFDGAKIVGLTAGASAPEVLVEDRAMGHGDVRVLNGGLKKWKAEGRPLEDGLPRSRSERHFTAMLNAELVRDAGDVKALISSKAAQIVDARPTARFEGAAPEPRAGLRSGHIPGSRNVPFASLVDGDGRLKSAAQLRSIFASAGVDVGKPIVASCGSGVTAGIVALALAVLGRADASVYDGSWSEWGAEPALPIETGAAP